MTVWAFDIETENWDRFVLGCAVSNGGEVIEFHTEREVAEWYRSTGPRDLVLSHFGGRFDFLFLIDTIREPWVGSIAGGGLVSCRVPGHADCRDTWRLFPLRLKDLTGAKTDVGLDCTCGKACGGYCAIRRDLPPAQRRRLMEYCLNDAKILLGAWEEWLGFAQECGLDIGDPERPRRTMGSVAWHTAVRDCGLDDRDALDWPEYELGRQAYYGGRTEVFRVEASEGHRYDLNSAYPHALTGAFPVGSGRVMLGTVVGRDWQYALSDVELQIPDGTFGLVPMRARDRIVWPTGRARGWYTHEEIETAVSHGARVVRGYNSVVWDRASHVYRPFIDAMYARRERQTIRGAKARSTWLKLIMNSLSGKLAQGPDSETLHVRPDDPRAQWRWLGGDAWVSSTRRIPRSAHPAHAAFVTGRTRAALLARLMRAGDAAIYCDTDSCYSQRPDETGVDPTRLGAWKYEGAMRAWRSLAPKVYRYVDDEGAHVKAKGIPDVDLDAYDALERREPVSRRVGVHGVRRALASHGRAFVASEICRTSRSPRQLAGTRYVHPTGTLTTPLKRDAEGRYTWPGVDVPPDFFGIRLT